MIKHGESWSRTESNSPNNISWNLVQSIDPQLSFLKKLTLDYTTIVLTSLAPYQERENKQLNENHDWTKHYKLYYNRKKNAKQLEKHC